MSTTIDRMGEFFLAGVSAAIDPGMNVMVCHFAFPAQFFAIERLFAVCDMNPGYAVRLANPFTPAMLSAIGEAPRMLIAIDFDGHLVIYAHMPEPWHFYALLGGMCEAMGQARADVVGGWNDMPMDDDDDDRAESWRE